MQLDAGESGQLAFSPDGRELAAAGLDSIGIWDLSTGTRRVVWVSHIHSYGSFGPSSASAMTYSPDGRWLVTGHPDNTALIREVPAAARSPSTLPNAQREAAWGDLSADDAAKAHQAVWNLADDSAAVEFSW